MAVHPRKTKPGTVPQPAPRSQAAVALDRLPFGKDIDGWPRQWMGFAKDVPPGEHLVQCFRPFLHHLIERQLSKTTMRKHVNNLWVLGGEIIRKLNDTPSLRKVPIDDLVFEVVEDGGVTLWLRLGRRRPVLRIHLPHTPPVSRTAAPLRSHPQILP